MRKLLAFGTAAGLLLSGCAQPVPDTSSQGVGFGDYAQYELERAQREAALTGTATGGFAAPATVAAPLPVASVPPGGISSSALAAAGIGTTSLASASLSAPAAPVGFAPAPLAPVPSNAPTALVAVPNGSGVETDLLRGSGVEASPGNAAPVLVGVAPTATPTVPQANEAGISDEQDFDAVASRETIESDAARRAQQAAQYQVVQPMALPEAPADTGPNIVEYALAAPNAKGQAYYSRFAFAREGRMLRNCAEYQSPDEAQRDFLARGGPERDSLGIDPDGDGFACAWDPAPFRAAVNR